MTRLLFALTIVATLTGAERRQDPGAPPAAGPMLKIDAVAIDRNGAPVTDLGKGDVEVWIGGYRVPVEFLAVAGPDDPDGSGRSIVLLLDDLTIQPAMVLRVREVARRFINRMAPGDEIAIAPLNGEISRATGDPTVLLRSLERYNLRPTSADRPDTVAEQVLNTVTVISRQLTEAPARRRAIVAIGASWLFDTPIPPPSVSRNLRTEWVEAMRAMGTANVALYVIDPTGVGVRASAGSSGFARDSGGHAFVNSNDMNAAVDQILREMVTYYTIGVVDPPVFRNADLRELDVRALRRDVTVRARRALPGQR